MSNVNIINFIIVSAGLALCILGLILILSLPYFVVKNKKYLTILFLILFAYLTSVFLMEILFRQTTGANVLLSKMFLFFQSFFSSLLMPVLSFFMIDTAGISKKNNKFLLLVSLLWVSYLIILIIAQFTDVFYSVDINNVYHRGPYFPLLLTPAILLMLSNLIALFKIGKNFNSKQLTSFYLYILLPTLAMIIQSLMFGILLIVLATSIATFLMLIFILIDQVDMYVEQNKVNATQKAKITVLEMRPHFIYNTLTSIYYLIDKDSKKAKDVLLNFTTYLRKNFSALVSESLVDFNQELEHTKNYLAIEQVRFENKLNIEYDCKVTDFKIPSLTLQPIVENSIKHGLDPEVNSLNIKISTSKKDNGIELVIEDDGIGFEIKEAGDEPSAINNIKERLAMMCDGTIDVKSEINKGTKVTINIH